MPERQVKVEREMWNRCGFCLLLDGGGGQSIVADWRRMAGRCKQTLTGLQIRVRVQYKDSTDTRI
jgi:hypothetical protein